MTNSFNPILGKEDIPRLRLFRPRPTPEPGVALFFFQPGQPLVTLWPGQRLTAGEVSWGNFKAIYKVDVTERALQFNCTLPCESDAFDFNLVFVEEDSAAFNNFGCVAVDRVLVKCDQNIRFVALGENFFSSADL